MSKKLNFKLFGLILIFGLFLSSFSISLAFTDTSLHNNKDAIEYLYDRGVVEGYSDGSYKPENIINRAEFVKILIESKYPSEDTGSNCFPDVETDWYAPYVCYAEDLGIIDGYDDGYFKPANKINLAEALKIVLETYEFDVCTDCYSIWYESYYWKAYPLGLLDDISTDIAHEVTRGEMAQFVYNVETYWNEESEDDGEDNDVVADEDEEDKQIISYCYLYYDSQTYVYKEYDKSDEDYDFKDSRNSEESCKSYAEDYYGIDYDGPTSSKVCYLSDDLKTYIYDHPENVSDYSSIHEGYSQEECRELAIDTYDTDEILYLTLNKGDEVLLGNNIKIDIEDIEIASYSDEVASVTVTHYIETPDGELYRLAIPENTQKHYLDLRGTGNEPYHDSYGYRITLDSINEDGSLEVHFTPLTTYISYPEDLYNECMYFNDSRASCYPYSLFWSIDGERRISNSPFVIMGPEKTYSYMQYVSNQMNYCYNDVVDYLGIESSIEEIPVHLLPIVSGVTTMSGNGIRMIVGPDQYEDYSDEIEIDYCNEPTLTHELVHAVVFDGPISDIVNEGLATYFEQIVSDVNSVPLVCESNGYRLDEEFSSFGSLNAYEYISYNDGGSDLYYTAACFWEEYNDLYGYDNFVDTMKVFDDNRDDHDNISTFELISNNVVTSIDWDYFREKYGFGDDGGGEYPKDHSEYTYGETQGYNGGGLWD